MERTYKGETKVLNNGLEATIIEFRDFYDIDVQLCTGETSCHQQYIDFQRCDAAALGFYKKPAINEMPEEDEDTVLTAEDIAMAVAQPAVLYHYLHERKDG